MPLYEYKCKECGHRFELIQSFSAEDAKECPLCHGKVERLISTPARAHFKGSGFYSTDYASSSAKSADSGSGSSSSDGASKASGGTDKGSGGTDKGSTDKGSAAKTESTATPAPASSSSKSE